MNRSENSFATPAVAPQTRWTRQRLILLAVVLISIVGASAYVGLRYVIPCSTCAAPILCTDPCTLPTFG